VHYCFYCGRDASWPPLATCTAAVNSSQMGYRWGIAATSARVAWLSLGRIAISIWPAAFRLQVRGFAPVAAPEAMAVIATRAVPCITLAAAYSMSFMPNLSARE
jgi:hypothetical protein